MGNFGGRLLLAVVLVGLTYNPLGYSFFHWLSGDLNNLIDPVKAIAAIVLLIGWVILLRATFRSLGAPGMLLVVAALGTLMWLLFDKQVFDVRDAGVWKWVGTIGTALLLAIGTSWSHFRRRLTGQVDADDISVD